MPQLSNIQESSLFAGPLPASTSEIKEILTQSKNVIAQGSKSFAMASRFFDRKTRDGATALYAWCRYVDDQVDGSRLGFAEKAAAAINKKEVLRDLKEKTKRAYQGEKLVEPSFTALQYAALTHQIPLEYPLALLDGMEMDVSGARYETINDLMLYCYRVAGVVGLMMSHIMGVSDEIALKNADAMGKAMQLTNICRDVMDDAKLGRVYLPLDWLREFKVDPFQIHEERYRSAVSQVVGRVLAVAKVLYLTGDQGLRYLPFRAAVAIGSARRIYAQIGEKILRQGKKAWDERQVVPRGQKILLSAAGLSKAIQSRPLWRREKWEPVEITTIVRSS